MLYIALRINRQPYQLPKKVVKKKYHKCVVLSFVFVFLLHKKAVSSPLTQQYYNTKKNCYKCSGAETHREEYGFCIAGQQGSIRITATHTDGQGAGAALYWVTTVLNDYWKVVELLNMPPKATTQGYNACSVVWVKKYINKSDSETNAF